MNILKATEKREKSWRRLGESNLEEILPFLPVTRICTQIFPSPPGPIKYQTNDTDTARAALVILQCFTWLCENRLYIILCLLLEFLCQQTG